MESVVTHCNVFKINYILEKMMSERGLNLCRCCESKRMTLFMPLGSQPPANSFLTKAQISEPEACFDLNTCACLNCGLVQIPNRIPDDFFRHYLYIPSASTTMYRHFSTLAEKLQKRYLSSPDSLLVDIGCNDGLLLKSAHDLGIKTLGVDPADNIVVMAKEKGLDVVGEYFNPGIAQLIYSNHGPATVITSSNTFNHIDDLHQFMEGVKILLAENGVFIIEVPQAIEYLNKLMFDNIYHEHLSVFSVKSLQQLYAGFGMEIVEIEPIDVQGGSMRVFARNIDSESRPSSAIADWLLREQEIGLLNEPTYFAYKESVDSIRDQLKDLLKNLKYQGKKIIGYGAPAKGNTLLNYYGIGPETLDYLADKSPLKQGLYSPGMHIPIVSPDEIAKDKPDYMLILAWNFADEIMEQQRDFSAAGGKFIIPIPRPKVI